MKSFKFCLIGIVLAACSEIQFGDEFLGEAPESSGATTEVTFSSNDNAERVLTTAYANLPYGLTPSQAAYLTLEHITDLVHSYFSFGGGIAYNYYYNGALNPSNIPDGANRYVGVKEWTAIRYAWLYIENIGRTPDISPALRNTRIAEAKMVIALCYFNMFRYVGGLPWLDHSTEVTEEMSYPRLTFAQTVEKIKELLDEAIPYLTWKQNTVNDGRMTKAGAMALKFKLLQWAASPTFNADAKWHPEADEYTCYGNYDLQRWKDAEAAGKAFFDELQARGQYALIQPATSDHQARRLAYRSAYYDRGGTECLISIRRGYDVSVHQSFSDESYYVGATLNYVNMFPWADGSDFPDNFNWTNPPQQPFFAGTTPTRDPRLYETVACAGDIHRDGTPTRVYENNRGAYCTGFLFMKFVLQQASDRNARPVHWPNTRLPEIMLGYAEVINQVNGAPTTEAYQLVNDIRARVGLDAIPVNLNKDQFLEAVLRERALELGFEEVRWFDLVRYGRQQDFTKKLYGLVIKANDLFNPTSYTFEKQELPERYWANSWDTKWYLSPLRESEVNKNYGMTQNPGWR
jgi:hypothetical protein